LSVFGETLPALKGDKGKVFDLIVQRSVVTGQVELDLDLDLDLNSNNNTQAPEQIISLRLAHLCSDTKFNVMLKAIINNIRLIACCVYSKFFDVGAFR
jgi:hypothetical protein